MTATFADYAASQDARNTIQLNVTKWTLMLCDALKQNYIDYSIKSHKRCLDRGESVDYNNARIKKLKNGECDYEFIIESGRKYHKIIMVIDNGPDRSPSRSVHAFVDKKTGQIYKSAVGNLLPKVFATILAILSRGSGCFRMPIGHLVICTLSKMKKLLLLLPLVFLPTPVMAQQVNQFGVCTQYQEVYVPGGYDQYGNYYPGGVQTQSYNVPCNQVSGGNWNPSKRQI
jgi:hypothetical protein